MNNPDKGFPSGPAATAQRRLPLFSPWKKGCFLGLILVSAALFFHQTGAQASCEINSPERTPANDYLMLKVGGFSAEITWSAPGC